MEARKMKHHAESGLERIQEDLVQVIDQVKPVADEVLKKSKKFYKEAKKRLPENSEKYIAGALAGVVIGTIVYQMGKRSQKSESTMGQVSQAASEIQDNLSPIASDLFSPALKLVKLWMLYKISL